MKQTNSFYKTKKWQKKREIILRRDEYTCRECRRYGKTTKAQVVHHVFPIENYPQFRLNTNNLISLCVKCHENMHNKQTNEITEAGRRWQGKVSPLLFKDW